MRRLLFTIAVACGIVAAQGVRYDSRVTTTIGQSGSLQTVIAVPFATTYVCSGVYTGTACTSAGVTVYADAALTIPITQPLVADAYGDINGASGDNGGFYYASGPIYYTSTPPVGSPAGPGSTTVSLPGAGAAIVTRDPYLDPRAYGAKCDGTTDDSTALQSWIDAVVAAHGTGVGPDTTCTFATALDVPSSTSGATSRYAITGRSAQFTLEYTGTAAVQAALWVEGSQAQSNVGLLFENLTIVGNSHSTNAFECDACSRSSFVNLRPRDAAVTSFECKWCDVDYYRNVSTSNLQDLPFTTVPVHGFVCDTLGTGAFFCTDSEVLNMQVEGVSGSGIVLPTAQTMTFVGGTSEGNAVGVEVDSAATYNTFEGTDTENNAAADFTVAGRQNVFSGIFSASLFHVLSGGKNNLVAKGNFDNITLDSGSSATTIRNVQYDGSGTGAITDSTTDGSTVLDFNYDDLAGGAWNKINSRPIPQGQVAGISPTLDALNRCDMQVSFTTAATKLCTAPFISASASWRALFIGQWANDEEGVNLPQLAPIVEATSAANTIAVGTDTLTLAIDGTSKMLMATESGPSAHVEFDGEIVIISGAQGLAGTASLALKGSILATSLHMGVTPAAVLDFASDASIAGDIGAFAVHSATSPAKFLYGGWDNSADAAYLQAIETGVGSRPLLLQPQFGSVLVGETSNATGAKLDVAGSIAGTSFLNGCSGVSGAMTAGTITITNACITGSRPISLVEAAKGGTQGLLSYTQAAGSLVITSSSNTDTSTVSWVQN